MVEQIIASKDDLEEALGCWVSGRICWNDR